MILNGLFDKFRKYSIVANIKNERIFLRGYSNNKISPLLKIFNKDSYLLKLEGICKFETDVTATIDLMYLDTVKEIFASVDYDKFRITLEKDIIAAILGDIKLPHINYTFDYDNLCLRQSDSLNIEVCNENWLRIENEYFCAENNCDFDLTKKVIKGAEIIGFLQFTVKQLSFIKCNIKLEDEKLLKIYLTPFDNNGIRINYKWEYPIEEFIYIEGLPSYILYKDIIYRDITPEKLFSLVGDKCSEKKYTGEDAVDFIENKYPLIKKWVINGEELVKNFEVIVKDNIKAVLYADIDNSNVVGKVFAVPYIEVNKEYINAFELSNKTNKNMKYLQVSEGKWIKVEDLSTIGIGFKGLQTDGTKLNEQYVLDSHEIIFRGSKRLEGIWSDLVFEKFKWAEKDDCENLSVTHLNFLRELGLSGGVISDFINDFIVVKAFISETISAYNQAKILIISKKDNMEILSEGYKSYSPYVIESANKSNLYAINSTGIFIVSPTLLEKCLNLILTKWDIVFFISFEELYKTDSSIAFKTADSLNSEMRLNFSDIDGAKGMTQKQLDALYRMVGSYDNELNKYLFRNTTEEVIRPNSYKFSPKTHKANLLEMAEIVIDGKDEVGLKIPKKLNAFNDEYMGVEINYTSMENTFINEAKNFENYVGKKAPHIDFFCYYPTYADMNVRQRSWYFYWRSEVKKGCYMNTSVSYIFVYIYEIINKIGWKEPDEGFELLTNIWMEYRKDYSKLDGYLSKWTNDFIILNKPKVNISDYLKMLHSNNISVKDTLFINISIAEKLNDDNVVLTFEEIELISSYKMSKSKFYSSQNDEMIKKTICDIFILFNRYFLKTHGKSILNVFKPFPLSEKRYPYSGAISNYARTEYTISILTYTNHKPLNAFVASVIRYTENILREENGYNGRLKNINLGKDFTSLIDKYFLNLKAKDNTDNQVFEIDMDKIESLVKESDYIIERLASEDNVIEDTKNQNVTTDIVFKIPETKEFPINESLPHFSDEFEWLNSLEIFELELIKAVLLNEDSKAIYKIAGTNNTMPEIMIDKINLKAMEEMEDLLIDTTANGLLITEEYQDVLKKLFEEV